jgi:hypothetical protein
MTVAGAQLRFGAIFLAVLFGTGCVRTNRNARWPEPMENPRMVDFDGPYSNWSVDPTDGQQSGPGLELFDFVTDRGHEHGTRGAQTELRESDDGSVLHVRLIDQSGAEIDKADLRRGIDFELVHDHLDIKGPFVGWNSEASNLAAYTEKRTSQLFVSRNGELLGKRSSSGGGFLFYFIPSGGKTVEWMLWRKLSSTTQR